MLRSLRIKNLALIEDLTWEPGAGLITLTGETGAGKSILIDGLLLLAGERADKSLIRSGESHCTVEAEIALPARLVATVAQLLQEIGAEPCDTTDPVLLIKRSLQAGGTNKQWINGTVVTLQALKQLGDLLIDFHGPHDHQSLLSPERQLELLDAFAGSSESLNQVARAYDLLLELQSQKQALTLSERERNERLTRLRQHTQEIAAARLHPHEDTQVEHDLSRAQHAQQIIEHAASIRALIAEDDVNILSLLAQVERHLTAWSRVDPDLATVQELSRSALAPLRALVEEVQDHADRVDLNPEQLRSLEDRLSLINQLKRKYGRTIESILEYEATALRDLAQLEDHTANLEQLDAKLAAASNDYQATAAALRKQRTAAAPELARRVQEALASLGFQKARFDALLTPLPEPTRHGLDHLEFMFAPNLGEGAQPLRAIASSGEMARVMLALKGSLAEIGGVPILIFDEVDANVGGETAWQVGTLLRALAATHQILCITHQPQVASQGHQHYAVQKIERDGRTLTQLTPLDAKSRPKELARMLGGESKESLALANRMMAGKPR